jgi:2-aminoethylphosphonate-pyruvate transaminase
MILNAMSSYAGTPIDLQRTPYDFVISSANKCLQEVPGVSCVIADRQRLESSAGYPPRK